MALGRGRAPKGLQSVSLAVAILLAWSCCSQGYAGSHHSPADPAAANSWCHAAGTAHWSQPAHIPSQVVLGKHDVYRCAIASPPDSPLSKSGGAVTLTSLQLQPVGPRGAELKQALLWDCDAHLWQLSGIQESEATCLASTAALRAACHQWLLTVPANGAAEGRACSPDAAAFATTDSLKGRVLVMQTHWRVPTDAFDTAVTLPSLNLALGYSAGSEDLRPAVASPAALLGTFVGSGIYPPSRLAPGLQAFKVPQSHATVADSDASGTAVATASLACGKRCTYVPLGGLFSPAPVRVVGYSFTTNSRATHVGFEVQRGKWGRSAGRVKVTGVPGGPLAALTQPFKLFPGDIVRWHCSYNMSGVQPGGALTGGFDTSLAAQQEQCTIQLHYWPRVEAMKGCSAALDNDALLGENMCSAEAEDLLRLTGRETQQFPMRRMYQEHSFPAAAWMSGWKATHILLQMAVVWCCLWGTQLLLSSCKALGPIHRRFIALHAGQQRNVSLYITHLLLDTAALAYVFRPMIELWFGLTETVAEVRPGCWGFTYIVACYMLELTWRRSIDTMLAIHHIGTITIILLYAGEFTASTYRVANNIIVLAAFALMEQPTYVALLLKRMLPSSSKHVVVAARVGYISWFLLKGASVLLAASMFVEDWHLMPTWLRVNFVLTWVVAAVVQGWSGFIQRGIYRHIVRSHRRAVLETQQEQVKRKTLAALTVRALSMSSSDEDPDMGATPPSSDSSGPAMTAPLLAADGFAAEAGDGSGGNSPFARISTEVMDRRPGGAAQLDGSSDAALSSDTEDSCVAATDKRCRSVRWQRGSSGSLSRSVGRLSSNSLLEAAQAPAAAAAELLPSERSQKLKDAGGCVRR